MPVLSLPPPGGIPHGKAMTTVLTGQALNLVTSQAKESAAVSRFAEGGSWGFYALEREEVRVFFLIHDGKLVHWQSQGASVNRLVVGWKSPAVHCSGENSQLGPVRV